MKKCISLLLILVTCLQAFAQQPEMADTMRSSGKIYVVVGVIAIIFAGLAYYLFTIDRRLRKVENQK